MNGVGGKSLEVCGAMSGWGQLVADGKYKTGRFAEELVTACVAMIREWQPLPAPQWVAAVPSLRQSDLVPDFAARLAAALGISYVDCVKKVRDNKAQKEMANSFQQAKNLDGAFAIVCEEKIEGACLLIDDMVDSRWTFTVVTALLRQAGCQNVYPLALALNSPRMD